MGGIFGVLLGGGVASIAYLLFWVRSRERMRLWQEAARAVGMTDLAVSTYFGVETKLTGTVGPLHVTIEVYQRGKEEHGTRVIVGGLRHGPYDADHSPGRLRLDDQEVTRRARVGGGRPGVRRCRLRAGGAGTRSRDFRPGDEAARPQIAERPVAR